MEKRIPQRIDHYRYTDKGVVLEGVISQQESEKDLPRLNDAIVRSAGDIEYRLEFDVDLLSNRIVSGFVKNRVILQCQRCMADFALDLVCDVAIAFVHNEFEEKNAEDSDYDVFWLEQKELLDPRVLIEDELLLALPQIAVHSGTDCRVQLDYPVNADEPNQNMSENGSSIKGSEQLDANNPFAVLKELKELKKLKE